MNQYIYILVFCSVFYTSFSSGQNVNKFNIVGKAESINGWVYLSYQDTTFSNPVIDSTEIRNNRFSFSGKINGPIKVKISNTASEKWFYLEPKTIFINVAKNGNFDNAKIAGSISEIEYELFQKIKDKDSILAFIEDHPNSVISAYALSSLYFQEKINLEETEKWYNQLYSSAKSSLNGQYVFNLIKNIKMSRIGNKAPYFNLKDNKGIYVDLDQFNGKYVLIDFWASWCIPCRKLSPYIRDLYLKYQKIGLELVSISIDESHEKWKAAIEEDNIKNGTQLINNTSYAGHSTADKYNVGAIPDQVIIDPKGFLIWRNTDQEDYKKALEDALSKIFGF